MLSSILIFLTNFIYCLAIKYFIFGVKMCKLIGGRHFYGPVIGILLLETKFPRVVGDVGNAHTYRFPVRFKVIKGANIGNIVLRLERNVIELFIKAAKELEEEGVRAITTSCGFTILFQEELAKSVKIPVFTSSLLMVPLVYRLTQGRVGILTANSKCLTEKHLKAAGIENIPIAIAGLEDKPEFSRMILEDSSEGDIYKIRDEVMFTAKELVEKYPDIKALVFECHNLSPFSFYVQKELKIPIFDFVSFVEFIYKAVVKEDFFTKYPPKYYVG